MLLSLIKKRRSIRKYKNLKIDPSIIKKICMAILWAPSSRGINPWEFIIITEKKILSALSCAKHGAEFLANAPTAIVITADPEKSDVWIEDASIVSTILLFISEDLGLGACWVQIRNRMYNQTTTAETYVSQLLNIPERYKVEAIIGIGYPNEEKIEHNEKDLEMNKIHLNSFNIKMNWE